MHANFWGGGHIFTSLSLHAFFLKIYIAESKYFPPQFLSDEVLLNKKIEWSLLFVSPPSFWDKWKQ